MNSQVATLARINLDDIHSALSWPRTPIFSWLVRSLFGGPATKFARLMTEFDGAVGRDGLVAAARESQAHYVGGLEIIGGENVPPGPFLAVSNHPGMTDTLALFRGLGREDLRILALRRPFLQALPHVERNLLYVGEGGNSDRSLLRSVRAHLRTTGAILTFPAGRIEPDPDSQPGAVQALASWTESAAVLVGGLAEATVLPVVVRGVVSARVLNHPLLRLQKDPETRGRLAAAVQLLLNMTGGPSRLTVRVQIGQPIYPAGPGGFERRALHQAVLTAMRGLLEAPP